jgi:hypothetical protein
MGQGASTIEKSSWSNGNSPSHGNTLVSSPEGYFILTAGVA